MADPRAEALMRMMSGGGEDPSMGMPPEEMPMEESEGPAEAVTQALTALEPFMDDPRIAQAAALLQEVAGGGPSEMPEDTGMVEEAPPML